MNKCKYCKKEFIQIRKSQKYCCAICQRKSYKLQYKKQIKLYMKKYRILKKDEIKKQRHEYFLKNKKRIYKRESIYKKTWRPKYRKNREQVDIQFRLLNVLRKRMWSLLRYNSKSASTKDLLGCSVKECKEHLEKQFNPGMSWKNHGHGKDKWNIDHIRPCSSFDLTKEEEQRKCFHYTNLQPLWEIDNIKKGNKYIGDKTCLKAEQ